MKEEKNHVGRMRRPFVVRHRVMCARSMARVRVHGEKRGTKKNSGVSVVRGRVREERRVGRKRERKRDKAVLEKDLDGCLTRRFEPFRSRLPRFKNVCRKLRKF